MTYQNPTYCQNLSVAFSHNTFFGETQKNENSRNLRLDYYPFGSPMYGRSFNSNSYKYGFNGQEKENEIYGEGNTYSAEYWMYDSRLMRRWNLDPIYTAHESRYACFFNNPVRYDDPQGLRGGDGIRKLGTFIGNIFRSEHKDKSYGHYKKRTVDGGVFDLAFKIFNPSQTAGQTTTDQDQEVVETDAGNENADIVRANKLKMNYLTFQDWVNSGSVDEATLTSFSTNVPPLQDQMRVTLTINGVDYSSSINSNGIMSIPINLNTNAQNNFFANSTMLGVTRSSGEGRKLELTVPTTHTFNIQARVSIPQRWRTNFYVNSVTTAQRNIDVPWYFGFGGRPPWHGGTILLIPREIRNNDNWSDD